MKDTTTLRLADHFGAFAEDKDRARELRRNVILPALKLQKEVILDFENIETVTQSFIHALISETIRKYGSEVLDSIAFKSCNNTIKVIIDIVVDYMQESDI